MYNGDTLLIRRVVSKIRRSLYLGELSYIKCACLFFQLVNSGGRKDGDEEEMWQLLAKPHCVGTGAFSQGHGESLKLF